MICLPLISPHGHNRPEIYLGIAQNEQEAAAIKAFGELQEIYKVAGAEGRCELFVGEGGHRYYRQGAWPFIRKWFKVEWSETCGNP